MADYNRISCKDKTGNDLEVGPIGKDHRDLLRDMYDKFDPKSVSQGLPPYNQRTRWLWIDDLLEKADNFALWNEDQIVGHSVLVPVLAKLEGEFLIFLSKQFRDRGLGATLARLVVERAKELNLARIWLDVEAYNFTAINLFKKLGFKFHGRRDIERVMVLELDQS